METTPPLPSGFNINGYLIQSLKQTDPLCHVYFAADSSHVQYLVREFCPQGLAVRDPESGKLRYPESTDIEQEVIPLKNDFEAQFRTGALAEIPAQGTLYLVYAMPGAPIRLPGRRSPRPSPFPSSATSGPWPRLAREPPFPRSPCPSRAGRRVPWEYGFCFWFCWGEGTERIIILPTAAVRKPLWPRNRPSLRKRGRSPSRKPGTRTHSLLRKWQTPLNRKPQPRKNSLRRNHPPQPTSLPKIRRTLPKRQGTRKPFPNQRRKSLKPHLQKRMSRRRQGSGSGGKGKTVFRLRPSGRSFPQRTCRRNRLRRQAPRNGASANHQYGGTSTRTSRSMPRRFPSTSGKNSTPSFTQAGSATRKR